MRHSMTILINDDNALRGCLSGFSRGEETHQNQRLKSASVAPDVETASGRRDGVVFSMISLNCRLVG